MVTSNVSVSDVRGVINTSVEDGVIEGALDDAEYALEMRTKAAGVHLDDGQIDRLVKFLAAHFVRLTYDKQSVETQALDARVRYKETPTGIGLRATDPGRVVLTFDNDGLFGHSSPGGFVGTASPGGSGDTRAEYSEREN